MAKNNLSYMKSLLSDRPKRLSRAFGSMNDATASNNGSLNTAVDFVDGSYCYYNLEAHFQLDFHLVVQRPYMGSERSGTFKGLL